MKTSRLEAFSDGVMAIIITIMVLELKIPHGTGFEDLKPLLPTFLSYLMSFAYVGIYWNNHHHLFQAVEQVNGKVLWANLFLLLCLSLFPFSTAWLGENHIATVPVVLYGVFLLLAAFAWYILARFLIDLHGKDSTIAIAYGKDWKGKLSVVLYLIAILFGFFYPWVSIALYVAVAFMWFIPDRRIEKNLNNR